MGHCLEAMVEAIVVSLFKTVNQEISEGKETSVHQAIEKVPRQEVARGTVKKLINLKIDNSADWKDFLLREMISR